jgi:hypothetical protein
MVVSFAAWGSFTTNFSTERLVTICLLYFLTLGVSAHCLDAIGSKSKPWGVLSKKKVLLVSLSSLFVAFAIGLHYAFLDAPLLIPIGITETFFLFSYNLEFFKGKFHNEIVFVVSWGVLPVFAGSVIQINGISMQTLALSAIAATLSFVLIKTSKKYKKLIRENDVIDVHKEENILKLVSIGVIVSTIFYLVLRYA